jgi:ABC-type sugar transport system ATPase subunit
MGDRIVVLSAGRVLQAGTPQEIYSKPASPAVAKQVGQPRINLVPVTAQGGQYVTEGGVPLLAVPPGHNGSRMTLGVRPEDIALEGGAHAASIELVEDTGPAKVAVVVWGGQRVHVLIDKHAPLKPKDQVFPRLRAERVVLWPAER